MTRDEVLEEAADALASEAVDDQFAMLREGPAIVRALKSKPPEESPEVECPQCAEVQAFFRDFDRTREENWQRKMAAPICAYGCERPTYGELATAGGWDGVDRGQAFEDAIRGGWLGHVRTCPNHPQRAVEAERDALKAQLEATERRAKEALARVEALTAEVKHREWVNDGAKMKGEGP